MYVYIYIIEIFLPNPPGAACRRPCARMGHGDGLHIQIFTYTHTHTRTHSYTHTKAVMLRHLWLNGNRLSVAPRMSLCPLLQTLNLSDNQLVYPPSLGGFGVVCSNVLQCDSVRRA